MPAAWVTAGVGLYNAYQSSQNKGGSAGQAGTGYVPTGLGGADQFWQNNSGANQGQLTGYGGFANNVDPNLYNAYQQLSGIDYNPYLQASQQAGQQYGNLANQAGMAGSQLGQQAQYNFGQQQQLGQAGQQLWNTAQDPQSALYARTLQQVQDQANATNSMYGLGSSAAGAGLTNQATNNFNIDWQNQQLARQAQGLQGMAQANQSGINSGSLGSADQQASMGYYGQQPGFTQMAGQVPLQAQQNAYGQGFTNANNYAAALGSAMSPYNQQQNQETQYMGMGSAAGATAYQNQLAGNMYQNQLNQQLGNSLGQVNWGQLSNMFGGGGSNTTQNNNGYGGYGTTLYGDGYGPG